MARGRARPERRAGRQEREAVPARPGAGDDELWRRDLGGDDPDGSAGVREPRRPRPLPQSGAGAAPIPEPPLAVALPDSRY
jgi:hypothetical protein